MSVINQTYSKIEYIIIDGGSTDGTVDIIKKHSHKISYWISEKDNGIYDAMNKGIEIASGDYIQFLNASDTIYKLDTIQNIVNQITDNTIDVLYGNIIIERINEFQYMQPAPLETFKNRFPIYHPSTWVKTNILKNIKFDTSYKIAADFNFFRTIYYNNYIFHYIPLIFVVFDGMYGISSTNSQILEKEKNKILNIRHKFINTICKTAKNLTKKIIHKILNLINRESLTKYQSKPIKDPRIFKTVIKE